MPKYINTDKIISHLNDELGGAKMDGERGIDTNKR